MRGMSNVQGLSRNDLSGLVARFVDVLSFSGNLVQEKRTYSQAHVPLGHGER